MVFKLVRPFYVYASYFVLFPTFCAVSVFAASPTEIDNLVLQWNQIERQKSQITSSWAVRKQMLELQLQLLVDEEVALSGLLENSDEQQTAVEVKRAELLSSQESMETSQALVESSLARALITLHNLHALLPPPLKNSWNQNIARLNMEGTTGSEQLEASLELLNQLEEFNSRIAVSQVLMTFEGGQQVQVDQLYVGIAQGWYLSANGDYFGYGRATPEGWEWQHKDSLSGELALETVQSLFANAKQEVSPQLVSLPIDITDNWSVGAVGETRK